MNYRSDCYNKKPDNNITDKQLFSYVRFRDE